MTCLGSCLGQWFQWGVKNRRNFIWLHSNTNPPACWGTKDAPFINSAHSDIVMPYFHALDLISLFYSLDLALYFAALRPSCRRCLHHLVWSESVIITLKRSVESCTFSLPFLVTVNTIKSWQRMTSLHWSDDWRYALVGEAHEQTLISAQDSYVCMGDIVSTSAADTDVLIHLHSFHSFPNISVLYYLHQHCCICYFVLKYC